MCPCRLHLLHLLSAVAILIVPSMGQAASSLCLDTESEPPRDCRRPQLLRGWGYGHEEDDEQIFG